MVQRVDASWEAGEGNIMLIHMSSTLPFQISGLSTFRFFGTVFHHRAFSMNPIHAEYEYTEAEVLRATIAVANSTSSSFRFLPWLGALLFLGNSIHAISTTPHDVHPYVLTLTFLMSSLPLLMRWIVKILFRRSPYAGTIISWKFSESQIEKRTTRTEHRFEWNRLLLVRQRKFGFLVYFQPRIPHWIPKRAFKSKEDRSGFMRLIKNSGVKYKNSSYWQ